MSSFRIQVCEDFDANELGPDSPHKRVCSPQTRRPSRPHSGQNRALRVALGRR